MSSFGQGRLNEEKIVESGIFFRMNGQDLLVQHTRCCVLMQHDKRGSKVVLDLDVMRKQTQSSSIEGKRCVDGLGKLHFNQRVPHVVQCGGVVWIQLQCMYESIVRFINTIRILGE